MTESPTPHRRCIIAVCGLCADHVAVAREAEAQAMRDGLDVVGWVLLRGPYSDCRAQLRAVAERLEAQLRVAAVVSLTGR